MNGNINNISGESLSGISKRNFLSLSIFSKNIITREIYAGITPVTAIAILQGMIPLIGIITVYFGISSPPAEGQLVDNICKLITASSVVVSLLLGVLCGAEEEENNTMDFVQRLPVSPMKVLFQKILGSILCFLFFIILISLINSMLIKIYGYNPKLILKNLVIGKVDYIRALSWGPLLYCFGLVAGVFSKKVIPAAIIGGGGALLYSTLGLFFKFGFHIKITPDKWSPQVLWWGCFVVLILTVVRFSTREGK